jgi:hypothetical protein
MASEAVKLEREKRRTAREERLWNLLTDPMVKRLVLLAGIVGYTAYVNSHPEESGPVQNALAIALPAVGGPMLASDAGIHDWKALAAIAVACGGLAAITNEDVKKAVTWYLPGTDYPLASLEGPIPTIEWWKEKFS